MTDWPFTRGRALDEFAPGMIQAFLGGDGAVLRFPENRSGRDFVVGDVHGMFRTLRAALEEVNFRPEADRLFSVGDLIDRGPDSVGSVEWIRDFPWFHSIRGNHDQMLLDAVCGPEPGRSSCLDLWLHYNGGEWWLDTDEPVRRRLVDSLAGLPFAIEIEGGRGTVGIVHADVPPDRDWGGFLDALRQGDPEDSAHALWWRSRLLDHLEGSCEDEDVAIRGVHLAVSGHVPLAKPRRAANRWWIDTGAVYRDRMKDPRLTLLQLNPGEPVCREFRPIESPD